jgi:hypothetical protein
VLIQPLRKAWQEKARSVQTPEVQAMQTSQDRGARPASKRHLRIKRKQRLLGGVREGEGPGPWQTLDRYGAFPSLHSHPHPNSKPSHLLTSARGWANGFTHGHNPESGTTVPSMSQIKGN